MNAELTVIVPTLNHRDYLTDCLASLQKQTFNAFGTLVVDDGSSEDIEGFVRQEFPEVQVLRLPRNQGFAAAVNPD